MNKPFPIRIRTFVVPLAGVALYYYVQFVALSLCTLIYHEENTSLLLSRYFGSFSIIESAIMAVCLFAWFFTMRKTTWQTVRRDNLTATHLMTMIPIALAMLGIVNLYMIGIQFLSGHSLIIKDLLDEYTKSASIGSGTRGLETAGYYIGVGIFIPVIEELLFRGIILGEFLSTMKADIAVILTALIFGMMHMQPVQIVYAIACGLILGYVYLYSNSIFLSILIHILLNLLGGILPAIFANNLSALNILGFTEIFFILAGVFCILYLRKSYRNKMIRDG